MKAARVAICLALGLGACSSASAPAPVQCVDRAATAQAPTSVATSAPSSRTAAPSAPEAGQACHAGAGDYSPCGSADAPRRCFKGTCYEPNECAAQCGRQLALELAADLAATFPHCSGPKAPECRASLLQDERHPLRIKAQARAEACLVDCGYPSLALPGSAP